MKNVKQLILSMIIPMIMLLPGISCTDDDPGNNFDPTVCEDPPDIETVEYVNPANYIGKYYEIASIPAWFQSYCVGGTTATYTLREDGDIDVLNECYTDQGDWDSRIALAWIVDDTTNAKLKVNFAGIRDDTIAGDYWIIDLDENYKYAVVGYPSREYGWILSRTPEIDNQTLQGILSRLERQCYDLSQFKYTNQIDYSQ